MAYVCIYTLRNRIEKVKFRNFRAWNDSDTFAVRKALSLLSRAVLTYAYQERDAYRWKIYTKQLLTKDRNEPSRHVPSRRVTSTMQFRGTIVARRTINDIEGPGAQTRLIGTVALAKVHRGNAAGREKMKGTPGDIRL